MAVFPYSSVKVTVNYFHNILTGSFCFAIGMEVWKRQNKIYEFWKMSRGLILDLPKKKVFFDRRVCGGKMGEIVFKLFFQLCVTLKTPEKSITIYFRFIRRLDQSRSPETSKNMIWGKMSRGLILDLPKKSFFGSAYRRVFVGKK